MARGSPIFPKISAAGYLMYISSSSKDLTKAAFTSLLLVFPKASTTLYLTLPSLSSKALIKACSTFLSFISAKASTANFLTSQLTSLKAAIRSVIASSFPSISLRDHAAHILTFSFLSFKALVRASTGYFPIFLIAILASSFKSLSSFVLKTFTRASATSLLLTLLRALIEFFITNLSLSFKAIIRSFTTSSFSIFPSINAAHILSCLFSLFKIRERGFAVCLPIFTIISLDNPSNFCSLFFFS